jgi:carbonic anhydrase
VQQAWKIGQELRIHGLVFSLENGRLIDLNITMHTLEQLPE